MLRIGPKQPVAAGHFGAVIAVFLTIASGMSLWQFVPGRIDHHAPQIIGCIWMQ
jgi:hypothetical protein